MNIAKCSSGISEKDDGAFKWAPKFKNYPHFDKPIIQEKVLEVSSMVTDKALVKAHTFFPFLCYKVTTKKFSSDNKKVRPILYAAHKDSHIYSYYRHLLAKPYENILKKKGTK